MFHIGFVSEKRQLTISSHTKGYIAYRSFATYTGLYPKLNWYNANWAHLFTFWLVRIKGFCTLWFFFVDLENTYLFSLILCFGESKTLWIFLSKNMSLWIVFGIIFFIIQEYLRFYRRISSNQTRCSFVIQVGFRSTSRFIDCTKITYLFY